MELICREVWQQDYSHLAYKEPIQKHTPYGQWRRRARQQAASGCEFTLYIKGTDGNGTVTQLSELFNPVTW